MGEGITGSEDGGSGELVEAASERSRGRGGEVERGEEATVVGDV